MSNETPIPLNKWKARYVCPVHGPTSFESCIQCHAEAALRAKLAKQRESLKAKGERIGSTLTNDEGIE